MSLMLIFSELANWHVLNAQIFAEFKFNLVLLPLYLPVQDYLSLYSQIIECGNSLTLQSLSP